MLYSESVSHTAAEGPRRHRLTVADYYRMGEAGILAPHARVELIDGEIIDMAPIGFRHVGTVDKFNRILVMACADRAIVRAQSPIRLGLYSEPQPDVSLLRPRSDFYTTSPAAPDDVLLVIEVAATSQRYDRDVKLPLYAGHGIPEVWLIDLEARGLVRHRRPQTDRYVEANTPDVGTALAITALPGVAVDLSGLFG